MHDNSLIHFNHYLEICNKILQTKAYLDLDATMNPLFFPGCPISCAKHEIIRHA